MGIVAVIAECRTCGKKWESRNAHGVGARHAQIYGHKVTVDTYLVNIYDYRHIQHLENKGNDN